MACTSLLSALIWARRPFIWSLSTNTARWEDAACERLRQVPGIGPLVSTAMVAAVGNGAAFRKGREFAAWLGLVPRQHSTGGKTTLYGISKRGNIYLRSMFIHGARAVLLRVKYDTEGSGAGCTDWKHERHATR